MRQERRIDRFVKKHRAGVTCETKKKIIQRMARELRIPIHLVRDKIRASEKKDVRRLRLVDRSPSAQSF